MPSRHAACAVVIVFSVILYIHSLPLSILGLLSAALVCMLRIVTGLHYTSDVLAAVFISTALSLAGYFCFQFFL